MVFSHPITAGIMYLFVLQPLATVSPFYIIRGRSYMTSHAQVRERGRGGESGLRKCHVAIFFFFFYQNKKHSAALSLRKKYVGSKSKKNWKAGYEFGDGGGQKIKDLNFVIADRQPIFFFFFILIWLLGSQIFYFKIVRATLYDLVTWTFQLNCSIKLPTNTTTINQNRTT